MKEITFYFDVISPYAYLAFEKLPETLQGIGHRVTYRPILFAALLKHHGQLGPAEIAPKRTWTYQQVLWLAGQSNLPMQTPAAHPFNPLPLLRLLLATGEQPSQGTCNRYAAETVFRHVWRSGLDAADATRTEALALQLQPRFAPSDTAVKQALQDNTSQAIAAGVFGVPSCVVDEHVFWGADALPMLRQYLLGDAWFDSPAWTDTSGLPVGAHRKPHGENLN